MSTIFLSLCNFDCFAVTPIIVSPYKIFFCYLNLNSSRAAECLMAESGCRLDHPAAAKFRQHVMDGDWSKADHDLQELRPLLGTSQSLVVGFIRFFKHLN